MFVGAVFEHLRDDKEKLADQRLLLEGLLHAGAIERRGERAVPASLQHLLHHCDRGCQFTSDATQQTLRTLGMPSRAV